MVNLLTDGAEAYSLQTFKCVNCDRDFDANVITWVDVSRAPQAKHALLKREFNMIGCVHCGRRFFSETPFFYEDFEEGLLIAVFPLIPDGRGDLERGIRKQYGYYPVFEFFYDMSQLWMLLYFQEYYETSKNLRVLSKLGKGEMRLRKILHFLKEDPLMIEIREKLAESFLEDKSNDELADILGQAVYMLEEMLPWPLDRRCCCGADLSAGLECCGKRICLDGHDHLLSRRYIIYCPICKEAISGASCGACGRVYTWKLGIVDSYGSDKKTAQDTEQTILRRAQHIP
jgi:hypothetical protein